MIVSRVAYIASFKYCLLFPLSSLPHAAFSTVGVTRSLALIFFMLPSSTAGVLLVTGTVSDPLWSYSLSGRTTTQPEVQCAYSVRVTV